MKRVYPWSPHAIIQKEQHVRAGEHWAPGGGPYRTRTGRARAIFSWKSHAAAVFRAGQRKNCGNRSTHCGRRVDALEKDLGVSPADTPRQWREADGRRRQDLQRRPNAWRGVFVRPFAGGQSFRKAGSKEKCSWRFTEGLGVGWLMPQIPEFLRSSPKLTLNLRCKQTPPDLLRLGSGYFGAIGTSPRGPDLKVMEAWLSAHDVFLPPNPISTSMAVRSPSPKLKKPPPRHPHG